jgi:hypothetical protein
MAAVNESNWRRLILKQLLPEMKAGSAEIASLPSVSSSTVHISIIRPALSIRM